MLVQQIYRKAALKIILDHGEVFPEPIEPESATTSDSAPSSPSSTQESSPNEPGETTPKETSEAVPESKMVTTQERNPLRIPEYISMRITPDNLKEYVGPPVYHKDRMYVAPPPPGVSTGLGYLGNGSGAVMPVEATVM